MRAARWTRVRPASGGGRARARLLAGVALGALGAALTLSAAPVGAADPDPGAEAPAEEGAIYTRGEASRDGIGKFYMGREISFVMGHRGAAWLERPEREREERPEQVLEALALEPDAVVADIGAGTGYFSFRIAKRVPEGRVLAVDIQPEMLERIAARREESGLTNVEPVRGTIEDPRLPAGSVDLALMVDAYHEFSHPREMMSALVEALRPGGRVALVEYRGEDPSIPIFPLHKMTVAQARLEMEAVGLRWVETLGFLPQQHLMIFAKPAPAGASAEPAHAERGSGGEGVR